jgi:hypothetical protein
MSLKLKGINKKKSKRTENKVLEAVKRFFGDEHLEVVGAVHELRLQPNTEDIATAIPNSPTNCALANAAHRMFGSTAVFFWGTVAYVDLIGPDGVRRIERFYLSKEAMRYAASLDLQQKIDPGGFILLPPTPSRRLDTRLEKGRRLAARKKAKLVGQATGKSHSGKGKRKPPKAYALTRNGTGQVQFIPGRTTA